MAGFSVYARAAQSILTLYMLLILLRWLGPWLLLDLRNRRWRWICRLTDPLIAAVRRILPPMGPVDFGPLGAVLLVWVVRVISVNILVGITGPIG